jgi:hypothetical protein
MTAKAVRAAVLNAAHEGSQKSAAPTPPLTPEQEAARRRMLTRGAHPPRKSGESSRGGITGVLAAPSVPGARLRAFRAIKIYHLAGSLFRPRRTMSVANRNDRRH